MDDLEVTQSNGFRERVEQAFVGADAAQVLAAHDWALKMSGASEPTETFAADVLLRHHAEPIVVAAALLVPLRRCRHIELGQLRSRFGERAANLVENASHEGLLLTMPEAQRTEYLRLFLESNAEDPSVAILRIGLRLAELERIAGQNSDSHQEIAHETLDLYVPLADQLGMRDLCTHLEDLCFQVLEPAAYQELARNVEPIQREDAVCLRLLEEGVRRLLVQNSMNARVYGRTKGLYSLYRKMCRRQCSVQDIMDEIGLRVIVPSVGECYVALGLLHTHFPPIPGTFDDYIGLPKDNGYQALHTCVYPVPGISFKPVEFQIQTDAMHQQAQFGIAAHWRYKDTEASLVQERQAQWLRSLPSQHDKAVNHAEFIECLRRQVYDFKLVIFGPGGRRMWLPQGSLVRDLYGRFDVNSEEGYVVKINGVICPPDHSLRDGDTVELVACS
jgi:(p)ppGpp synthase/HD superfamily hydrolase